MKKNKSIHVGIGFATGRKGFQKVLRSYIHNWKESGLVDNEAIDLNLFIAYDLSYANTKVTDYTFSLIMIDQTDFAFLIKCTTLLLTKSIKRHPALTFQDAFEKSHIVIIS